MNKEEKEMLSLLIDKHALTQLSILGLILSDVDLSDYKIKEKDFLFNVLAVMVMRAITYSIKDEEKAIEVFKEVGEITGNNIKRFFEHEKDKKESKPQSSINEDLNRLEELLNTFKSII